MLYVTRHLHFAIYGKRVSYFLMRKTFLSQGVKKTYDFLGFLFDRQNEGITIFLENFISEHWKDS